MFGRRLSNASRKNKSQWYEWPILIAVTTAALALIGQFMVTLLPVNGKIKFPNYGSENSSDLLKTFAFCFFDWIDSEELG
jgi:hypothetical protein